MTQKAVFFAGFIGLVFGFLLSGTLGIDFFPEENSNIIADDDLENPSLETLKKDEEDFRLAYNLTDSIYLPISGDDVYDKIADGDTFILYAGRDTCPYCQQYVPVLQTAAENRGIELIFHVDTTDSLNSEFVNSEGIYATPTTFIYKDGVLIETIVGYQTQSTMEQLIIDSLS